MCNDAIKFKWDRFRNGLNSPQNITDHDDTNEVTTHSIQSSMRQLKQNKTNKNKIYKANEMQKQKTKWKWNK